MVTQKQHDEIIKENNKLKKELEEMKENVLVTSLNDMKNSFNEKEKEIIGLRSRNVELSALLKAANPKKMQNKYNALNHQFKTLLHHSKRMHVSCDLFNDTLLDEFCCNGDDDDEEITLTAKELRERYMSCSKANRDYNCYIEHTWPLVQRCIDGVCGGCTRAFCNQRKTCSCGDPECENVDSSDDDEPVLMSIES